MNEQSFIFFRHLEDAVVKALEISDTSNPKRFFGCLIDIAGVDPEINGAPEFSLLPYTGRPEFLSCFRGIVKSDQIPEWTGKAARER